MPILNSNPADIFTQSIIDKIIGGDKEKFGEIVDLFQDKIMLYCLRMLNFQKQDAEDATSQCFLNVYKNLTKYNAKFSFSSWIYRIAHNICVDIIKEKAGLFYFDIEEFIPHFSNNLDDEEKKEIDSLKREKIEKGLEHLKQLDKSLIILFHLEEKSLLELSDIYKLSTNTIAVKLKRARARLKQIIEQKYDK